jgi:hypothetical protein
MSEITMAWMVEFIDDVAQNWKEVRFCLPYTYSDSMKDTRTEFNKKLYQIENNLDKIFQR